MSRPALAKGISIAAAGASFLRSVFRWFSGSKETSQGRSAQDGLRASADGPQALTEPEKSVVISRPRMRASKRIPRCTSNSNDAGCACWEIEVFFDGDCPLCRREIAMLQRLDRKRRIRFTDTSAEDFDAADYGISHQELMSEIHARFPDGSWITGVEVFRRLYGAVGFRWLIPFTRLPGISSGLALGYRVFVQNRMKWTGRCSQDSNSCQLTPSDPWGHRIERLEEVSL